jgi:hypothetical protein
MKTEIPKTFNGFSELQLVQIRALVRRAEQRGWIRFPTPSSSDVATVRKKTKKRATVKRHAR